MPSCCSAVHWHGSESHGTASEWHPPLRRSTGRSASPDDSLQRYRRGTALNPRWHESPEWWRALLVAAESEDEKYLDDIHLHAKLLLCGELVPRAALEP